MKSYYLRNLIVSTPNNPKKTPSATKETLNVQKNLILFNVSIKFKESSNEYETSNNTLWFKVRFIKQW